MGRTRVTSAIRTFAVRVAIPGMPCMVLLMLAGALHAALYVDGPQLFAHLAIATMLVYSLSDAKAWPFNEDIPGQGCADCGGPFGRGVGPVLLTIEGVKSGVVSRRVVCRACADAMNVPPAA